MNRNTKLILAALAAVVLLSVAVLLLGPKNTSHPTARITVDGQLVEEIDLQRVTKSYSFTLEGPGGFSNTVLVEPGRIRISQAGCPDQVCVHQGYISNGTIPIVCLPNKLIIEIIGGGDALDAATG